MRLPSRYSDSTKPGRVAKAASMGSILITRCSIPSMAQSSCASRTSCGLLTDVGRERPCTLSDPIARQQNAAASAESTPPETPITIPEHPLFQYAYRIICSTCPILHPSSAAISAFLC